MKISVQKGDLAWEGTEKDLNGCPKELRQFAESAIAGPAVGRVFSRPVPPPGTIPAIPPIPPQAPHYTVPQQIVPATPARTPDLERQLKELSDQVEKLRQAVEKTQSKQ